jgi:uncharacterized protein (DUF488 family)
MICYTIGHSTRKLEEFINIIKNYGIDCVMDVRSYPRASNDYDKPYDRDSLEINIKQAGINYIYMGEELGENRTENEALDEEGKVDFDKVMECSIFKKGINKIVEGIKRGHKIVLMCSERNPFNCHRSILLGYALMKNGVAMEHVIDEEKSKSQNRIEEEIFITYEPLLKEKFLQLTIQDVLDKENYDNINPKDIKVKVIEEGYRRKVSCVCKGC